MKSDQRTLFDKVLKKKVGVSCRCQRAIGRETASRREWRRGGEDFEGRQEEILIERGDVMSHKERFFENYRVAVSRISGRCRKECSDESRGTFFPSRFFGSFGFL